MTNVHERHPTEERLQAFLDGDVSRREHRRIEEHVASCARCSEELAGWRVLFQDLDKLGPIRPSEGFQARVMAGVSMPDELPLAARVRARLASLLGGSATGGSKAGVGGAAAVTGDAGAHLDPGLLQDLADGVLKGRRAGRARAHLETCTACASELEGWTTVLARISELERFEPSPGFGDAVMTALQPTLARTAGRSSADTAALGAVPGAIATPAPTRARIARAWTGALAVARRVLPRTRRAWAALAGAAVTPAVTFGLVLYTVFSHPTLTPQALASYSLWQLTDLFVAAWSALVSSGLAVARMAGLDGLIQALLDAPVLAAGGFTLYAVTMLLALRVLYKNLIDSRVIRPRHVSASAS